VIADVDARTIDIAVTGDTPISRRNALAVVRTQFRSIHGSLASLEVEQRVPLPDRPEVAVPYEWLVDQEKRKRARAEWWDGQRSTEVDVQALLNGVETKEDRRDTDRVDGAERAVNEVFLSYAHKDRKWRDDLLTMLAPALREKTLDLWYDGKIKASQDWRNEIEAAMRRARVGVLLVSKHFLASEFIANKELPFLFEAAEKADVKLSWVLLGSCSWEEQDFAKLQALHGTSKPLAALRGDARDKAMKQVSQGILELARGR
jgi:hypothetical protein